MSALGFFLCTQLLGLLLRLQFVKALPGLNYAFFLHAHSHVGLLGWLHALLLLLLPRAFLSPTHPFPIYDRFFWASQVCVMGMLLSFPFQGYGAVSIAFSSMSLLVNYGFAYFLWRDTRVQHSQASWLLHFALFLMVLSSVGPWALGPAVAMKLKGTPLYHMLIYFYLHFMYNGWFLLGGLAYLFQTYPHIFQKPDFERAGKILAWATLPTFALSALWMSPPTWVWFIGGTGALMQLWVLGMLFKKVRFSSFIQVCERLLKSSLFWGVSCFCLCGKIVLQALTSFPFFAQMAASHRMLIIFYLHWVLLGVFSSFFLGVLMQENTLRGIKMAGALLFITGFFLSEALLLFLGFSGIAQIFYFNGYPWLFGVSVLIPFGTILVLLPINKKKDLV